MAISASVSNRQVQRQSQLCAPHSHESSELALLKAVDTRSVEHILTSSNPGKQMCGDKRTSDGDFESDAPHLRFGFWACVVGLVLGCAIGIPLKWVGLTPAHISWLGVSLVPASLFTVVGSLFAGPLFLGRRWPWLFVPVAFVGSLTMLAVILYERG